MNTNKPASCSPQPAWHRLHRPDDARHDEVGVEDAEGDLGGILDMREKLEKNGGKPLCGETDIFLRTCCVSQMAEMIRPIVVPQIP